ncbi:MAG: two-component system response regulator [Actinomycetota bacterium]|nr:response regulator [Actinomycetota bacterium]
MAHSILVVDDEPDVILLCRVNLEFEGYEVREAHDGAEALQLMAQEPPDLVLLDVMMPAMDGWQVLATMNSSPDTTGIPVVMLTAKAQDRDQIRGLSSGAIDYVTKPFNPVALLRTVKDALEVRSPADLQRKRRQMLDKLELMQNL